MTGPLRSRHRRPGVELQRAMKKLRMSVKIQSIPFTSKDRGEDPQYDDLDGVRLTRAETRALLAEIERMRAELNKAAHEGEMTT